MHSLAANTTTRRRRRQGTFVPGRIVVLPLLTALGVVAACGGSGASTAGSSPRPTVPSTSPQQTQAKAFADHAIVNGHALYVECQGGGSPTILLANGAGGNHHQWDPVFEVLADTTRTCRYDLPNTGDSDRIEKVRTVDDDVADLESLQALGIIEPPFLLVGYSAGAYPTWRLAAEHPDRVAGLVFVDPLLPAYDEAYVALLTDGERADYLKHRAGDNSERYDYVASSAAVDRASPPPDIPLDIIANDRHIRWQSCGPRCDSLTEVQQERLDELVDGFEGTLVRVTGSHAVIDEHPREVADIVLARVDQLRVRTPPQS